MDMYLFNINRQADRKNLPTRHTGNVLANAFVQALLRLGRLRALTHRASINRTPEIIKTSDLHTFKPTANQSKQES